MTSNRKPVFKWRTILSLILIAVAVAVNWTWVWGILFLIWSIQDLISQEAFLVERIARAENPVLYWIIIVTWFLLSVVSFIPERWWQI